MGYVRRKTLGLMLDGDLAGLDVTMLVPTVDTWLEVCQLTEAGLSMLPENKERIDRLREIFVEHGDSWSLEDADGTPVPFTVEALASQDKFFQHAVMDTWITQCVAVPVPLGDGSTGGQPVTAIPMDDLPASQAS